MLELWPVTGSTTKLLAWSLVWIWPPPAIVISDNPLAGAGMDHMGTGCPVSPALRVKKLSSRDVFTYMFSIYFSFNPCWARKLENNLSGECVLQEGSGETQELMKGVDVLPCSSFIAW